MATALALGALAMALAVHAELLARLRRVDEAAPPWWFGYARDGANLSAALMLWGAYVWLAFPSAVALCAAMLTTLAVYLLDWLFARALGLRRVRLALAVPFVAWLTLLLWAPAPLHEALGHLVVLAQPR